MERPNGSERVGKIPLGATKPRERSHRKRAERKGWNVVDKTRSTKKRKELINLESMLLCNVDGFYCRN